MVRSLESLYEYLIQVTIQLIQPQEVVAEIVPPIFWNPEDVGSTVSPFNLLAKMF